MGSSLRCSADGGRRRGRLAVGAGAVAQPASRASSRSAPMAAGRASVRVEAHGRVSAGSVSNGVRPAGCDAATVPQMSATVTDLAPTGRVWRPSCRMCACRANSPAVCRCRRRLPPGYEAAQCVQETARTMNAPDPAAAREFLMHLYRPPCGAPCPAHHGRHLPRRQGPHRGHRCRQRPAVPWRRRSRPCGGRRAAVGPGVTRYHHTPPRPAGWQRIEVVEASHPVPDAAGMNASQRILQLVQA